MNDEALRACIDNITTQVLTLWFRERVAADSAENLPLTRALAAIAYADGKCEMLPQAAWLNARFRNGETEAERAAIADAVCHMALTSRTPEKLATTALLALRDCDRFLQARGAGALALLGKRIESHSDLTPTLEKCWEDNRHDSGNVSEATREAPAHPAQISLALQRLSSNPSGFTRAVLMAVWAHLPAYRYDPRALEMLQAGMQDRLWGVGRIAAEAAVRLGVAEPIARELRQAVAEGAQRERGCALRALGHLAAAGDTASFKFLLAQLSNADITLRVPIAEALAQCFRCETDTALNALSALESRSDPLTKPLMREGLAQLQAGRGLRCEVLEALLNLLGGDSYGAQEGATGGKRKSASANKTPASNTGNNVAGSSATILLINFVSTEELGANVRAQQELAAMAQETEAYRSAQPGLALFSGTGYIGIAAFGNAEAVFACTIALTQAIRRSSLRRPRMAIHTGSVHLAKDGDGCRQMEGAGVEVVRSVTACGEPGHILVTTAGREALAPASPYHAFLDDLGSCFVPQRGSLKLFNMMDTGQGIGYAAHPGLKSTRIGSGKRKSPVAIVLRALPTLLLLTTPCALTYAAYRYNPSPTFWQQMLVSKWHTLQSLCLPNNTRPVKPPPPNKIVSKKPSKSRSHRAVPHYPQDFPTPPVSHKGGVKTPSANPSNEAPLENLPVVEYTPKFVVGPLSANEPFTADNRPLSITLYFRMHSRKNDDSYRTPKYVTIKVTGARWGNEAADGSPQPITNGTAQFELKTTDIHITVTPTITYTDGVQETLDERECPLSKFEARRSRSGNDQPQNNSEGTKNGTKKPSEDNSQAPDANHDSDTE